jgi:hypothetical protein
MAALLRDQPSKLVTCHRTFIQQQITNENLLCS